MTSNAVSWAFSLRNLHILELIQNLWQSTHWRLVLNYLKKLGCASPLIINLLSNICQKITITIDQSHKDNLSYKKKVFNILCRIWSAREYSIEIFKLLFMDRIMPHYVPKFSSIEKIFNFHNSNLPKKLFSFLTLYLNSFSVYHRINTIILCVVVKVKIRLFHTHSFYTLCHDILLNSDRWHQHQYFHNT